MTSIRVLGQFWLNCSFYSVLQTIFERKSFLRWRKHFVAIPSKFLLSTFKPNFNLRENHPSKLNVPRHSQHKHKQYSNQLEPETAIELRSPDLRTATQLDAGLRVHTNHSHPGQTRRERNQIAISSPIIHCPSHFWEGVEIDFVRVDPGVLS